MSSHQHYHQQTASVDGSVISHEEFPPTHTHTLQKVFCEGMDCDGLMA